MEYGTARYPEEDHRQQLLEVLNTAVGLSVDICQNVTGDINEVKWWADEVNWKVAEIIDAINDHHTEWLKRRDKDKYTQ